MAHGQTIKYIIMVSESNGAGKTYYKIGEDRSEKNAYEKLRAYTDKHPEVMSAYVERIVSFKNDKRKDWN